MASCTEGEAGTVKALISSCVPSPSSTVQVISQECPGPISSLETKDAGPRREQILLQKSQVKCFFGSSLNGPFLGLPTGCWDLRVARSHRPQCSEGSLRARGRWICRDPCPREAWGALTKIISRVALTYQGNASGQAKQLSEHGAMFPTH